MKEARIVMPCATEVSDWEDIHNWMAHDICEGFGGCTKHMGSGLWVGPHGKTVAETVIVYDIAMEDTDANVDKLCRIADKYGRALGQHSTYVRYPDGRVFITELK